MVSSKSISELITIITEKAALLDQLKQWKIINLDPNIAELKFDISSEEISQIKDLPLGSFKIRFLYNQKNRRPLFDVISIEQDPSGKIQNFTIGAWITSRDFETNNQTKVFLRLMIEYILNYYGRKIEESNEIEKQEVRLDDSSNKGCKKTSKRRRD